MSKDQTHAFIRSPKTKNYLAKCLFNKRAVCLFAIAVKISYAE